MIYLKNIYKSLNINKKDVQCMKHKRKYLIFIIIGVIVFATIVISLYKKKEAFNVCLETAKQLCIDNNVSINDVNIKYSQKYKEYNVYTIYVNAKSSNASMLDIYNLVKRLDGLTIDYDNTLLMTNIKIDGKEYELDVLNENILTCNGREIYAYVSEQEKNTRESLKSKYPYVGMREEYLKYTYLGEPDSIEKCIDFDKLLPRAKRKEYEWKETDEHGWWKVTVFYTDNKTGNAADTFDLPSDNGIVYSITYTDENGIIQSDYKGKSK